MNLHQKITPLIEQLELLASAINESPYISRETRLHITQEISSLSLMLHDGEISLPQGEQQLFHLNTRAAADEIATLSTKIRYLNPTSPRLENLRALGQELHMGEISASQARKRLQELMCA